MSILSDQAILDEMDKGTIIIEPYKREYLGTNSYDVHLGKYLGMYVDREIDARKHNKIRIFEIPEEGYKIEPTNLYLGVTAEYTETHEHVPFLEGKSSTGRLGIDIHATAGKGDVGFCNAWTLEISCTIPVKIYPGMPVGQLIYFPVVGEILQKYNKKAGAKYNDRSIKPVESMMWKNFCDLVPVESMDEVVEGEMLAYEGRMYTILSFNKKKKQVNILTDNQPTQVHYTKLCRPVSKNPFDNE